MMKTIGLQIQEPQQTPNMRDMGWGWGGHTKGHHNQIAQNYYRQTSLVVQWLRICQCRGHRFNSCSRKIPHTLGQPNPRMVLKPAQLASTHCNKRSHNN